MCVSHDTGRSCAWTINDTLTDLTWMCYCFVSVVGGVFYIFKIKRNISYMHVFFKFFVNFLTLRCLDVFSANIKYSNVVLYTEVTMEYTDETPSNWTVLNRHWCGNKVKDKQTWTNTVTVTSIDPQSTWLTAGSGTWRSAVNRTVRTSYGLKLDSSS